MLEIANKRKRCLEDSLTQHMLRREAGDLLAANKTRLTEINEMTTAIQVERSQEVQSVAAHIQVRMCSML